jgi:prepilin-type N-terminal cleavage/methylation domain-containing protein
MYRPTPERDGRFGFTLIELLIVVAIIAILAAIAIPNFLEAQTRSRVSRAKGDLRTLGLSLDSYFVDHSHYIKDNDAVMDQDQLATINYRNLANGLIDLTTPISYMSSIFTDPFEPPAVTGPSTSSYIIGSGDWSYPIAPAIDDQDSYATFVNHQASTSFIVFSPGPDRQRNVQSYKCFPWRPEGSVGASAALGVKDTTQYSSLVSAGVPTFYLDYDPSNGTVSNGDVQRFGGDFMSGNWNRFYQNTDGTGSGPSGPAAQ